MTQKHCNKTLDWPIKPFMTCLLSFIILLGGYRIDMDWSIKVADFGLSESTASKDYFRQDKDTSVKLPIKWMAPESLSDGVFSEKTDVVGDHVHSSICFVVWKLWWLHLTPTTPISTDG